MKHSKKNPIYPVAESHVSLTCNGISLHIDSLSPLPEASPLNSLYKSGIFMIFSLLESMVPGISCISVEGTWHSGEEFPFCAYSIWVQQEEDGFFLPMQTAAALFQNNGLPYYRRGE